ncbi:MAG: thiol:disulfide interchange protein DsbA/DsbL [Ferrovum sp.]|nr:thiol:disulfide interchange protein DsbA/DsbL [Ferrovum sp.]NDU87977.1 thiol:disulfide interchange protein DsbA/DsbL [Ferrovum sp.]
MISPRRLFLSRFATLLVMGSITRPLFAAVAGQDYQIISTTPLAGKSVEVLEIFSYACPHCAHLAPFIEPWSRKLPAGVVYRRIPVTFGHDQWTVLARAYYALEAMNEVNRLQEKVFAALHEQQINLFSEDVLFDWVAAQKVNRTKFIDLYRSFAVQSKVQQGDQRAMSYGVDGVPTVIVDGKYSTSPSQAGSNAALFPVLNELIATELAAKR